MEKIKILTQKRHLLADLVTPVTIYLRVREKYPKSILLESSDYHGNENSYSFICIDPVANFEVTDGTLNIRYPDNSSHSSILKSVQDFRDEFTQFVGSFEVEKPADVPISGIFGYCEFDAVQYFETIRFENKHNTAYSIPQIQYSFYRYVIAINHFKNDMFLIEHQLGDGNDNQLDTLEKIIKNHNYEIGKFKAGDDETSNLSDEEYKQLVTKGKEHCYRGDVFQIVLSRQFSQTYQGDDFNVYRALRSINPSPYLFYFDYGDYRILGSSPEAQIKVKDERAIINPIAGTFKRTGDDAKDKQLANELAADEKENAEHVMLVDLARNDLSRHASDVHVDSYREIQYYSHVLHMVSTVSGKLKQPDKFIDMMMATFPAGTLSGAPKYKAMQLIDKYENQNRGFYGGAIGYIGFDGEINLAIMIRTLLSKNGTLYYQAGAGIVSVSKEESELQEVNNKLGALKKAIEMAKSI